MKLSTRARYALRMMVEIALTPGAQPVSLGHVAENTSISRRYLDQVATDLKTSSLIRSMRGKGGGYRLNRPADQISVRQIIEAAIGPINVVECVLHPEACLRSEDCRCRCLYEQINDGITNLLNGMSLADLAGRNAGDSARSRSGQPSGGTGHPSSWESSRSG